jgi:hypothetical protein
MYSKYYRTVNSKINPSLGSIAIAAKKQAGHPVERRTVAHARNIMNIILVHEHNLVPTTMNETKSFYCNTCGTIYCIGKISNIIGCITIIIMTLSVLTMFLTWR